MMRYVIVKGDRDTVCDGVRRLLGDGWELHGGLIALEPTRESRAAFDDRFAQAMTKEEPEARRG